MWSSRCRGNGGAVTCARDRQRRAARYKGGARAAPHRKKKKTPASQLIPLLATPLGGSRSPRHEDPDDEKRLVPVLPRLMSVAPGELPPSRALYSRRTDEEETGSLCFEAAGEKMRDAGDVVGGLPRAERGPGLGRVEYDPVERGPGPGPQRSYPTTSSPHSVPTPPISTPPRPPAVLPHHLQPPLGPYPTHLHPPQAPSGPHSVPTPPPPPSPGPQRPLLGPYPPPPYATQSFLV
ncbi:unnamed protein product [Boreogadus saida]